MDHGDPGGLAVSLLFLLPNDGDGMVRFVDLFAVSNTYNIEFVLACRLDQDLVDLIVVAIEDECVAWMLLMYGR